MAASIPPIALAAVYVLAVVALQIGGRYLVRRPYEGSPFTYYQHVLAAASVAFVVALVVAPPLGVGAFAAGLATLVSLAFYGSFYFYARPLARVDLSRFQPLLNLAFLLEIGAGVLLFREPVTAPVVAGSLLLVAGAALLLADGSRALARGLGAAALAPIGVVVILWASRDVLARFVLGTHAPAEVLPFLFAGAPLLLALSLLSRHDGLPTVARSVAGRPVVAGLFAFDAAVGLLRFFAYAVLLGELGLVVFAGILALEPLGLVLVVLRLSRRGVPWLERPSTASRRARVAGAVLVAAGLAAYALA